MRNEELGMRNEELGMRNEELIFGLIRLIGVIKNKKNGCPQRTNIFLFWRTWPATSLLLEWLVFADVEKLL